MRKIKRLTFEELVKVNKVEIMKDKKMLEELEERWENRRAVR
ncbi:FbpB family small basic protein [Thalassorhabdus alkalitolerans]|uniref:FbpB family small basic protein n=1 Tax=Thalassorhabdus alkalitolerans TaxID=2282697 RepID=A0ABW0YJK7_9BACI|nr:MULTISPECIES: FbpB family small basic protein [Bacillaceae]